MEIKDDKVVVVPATHGPDGRQLEPEERPAARVLSTDASLSHGMQTVGGGLHTEIILEGTAGELAVALRNTCARCKHFDLKGFQHYRRDREASGIDGLREINTIRSALVEQAYTAEDLAEQHVGEDGEFDAEHALSQIGICRAITDIRFADGDPAPFTFMHGLASCPDEVSPKGTPLGNLFELNEEARKDADDFYDRVMGAAQGKVPEK